MHGCEYYLHVRGVVLYYTVLQMIYGAEDIPYSTRTIRTIRGVAMDILILKS